MSQTVASTAKAISGGSQARTRRRARSDRAAELAAAPPSGASWCTRIESSTARSRATSLSRSSDIHLLGDLAEDRPHLGLGPVEVRAVDHARVARARQVDADDVADAAGMGRHHDDPVGEHDGLGHRMRDEEHRLAIRLPEGEQAESLLLAVELVKRRE